ncbi:hypothetical protein [Bradyrhizobium barranii]
MEYQIKHSSPDRVFRAAVLNGTPIPEQVRAVLEARGVDTAELERRIRQQIEWRN